MANAEEVDFSGQPSTRPVPEMRRQGLRHMATSYVCEKAVGASKTCDFRSGKIILQQPIDSPPR
jgi:DNA topoisomerase-3